MSCSCDRYYEWFEEESRRAEDLEAEVERLRAELARANQRLVIADEMQQERVCLTPDYDRSVGPCHCAHCDPAALERDNAHLRAELKERKVTLGALVKHWRGLALDRAATIARVRRYAESRCNEEYQDYASASVVLAYLDGEVDE